MSIWAGIKHALNSTLGTSEFKPLDKLIRFEGKKLAVSDSTFLSLPNASFTESTAFTRDICTLTPSVGGSVRLSSNMTLVSYSSTDTLYGKILVYVNGSLKYTFQQSFVWASGDNSKAVVVTGDIQFNANDVISVKVSGSITGGASGKVSVSNMYVKAIVTDNLMEVSV